MIFRFSIHSDMTEGVNCDDNVCMSVSTGTAVKYRKGKTSKSDRTQCKCQCLSHLKTYREDTRICVNDIGECSLIPFVSSSISTETAERIPFVFLPLKGQIIYPSKELLFANGKQVLETCSDGKEYRLMRIVLRSISRIRKHKLRRDRRGSANSEWMGRNANSLQFRRHSFSVSFSSCFDS